MKSLYIALIILLTSININAASSVKLKSNKMYNAEVNTSTQNTVLLKDLTKDGKTIIFAFFSEWCAPCQAELDSLNQILGDLKSRNIEVIAVALNSAKNRAKIDERIAKKGWKMTFLYDDQDDAKSVYRISTLPHTMVVSPESKIVYEADGYNPEKMNVLIQVTQELTKTNFASR
jgi:peroxiredoxin